MRECAYIGVGRMCWALVTQNKRIDDDMKLLISFPNRILLVSDKIASSLLKATCNLLRGNSISLLITFLCKKVAKLGKI